MGWGYGFVAFHTCTDGGARGPPANPKARRGVTVEGWGDKGGVAFRACTDHRLLHLTAIFYTVMQGSRSIMAKPHDCYWAMASVPKKSLLKFWTPRCNPKRWIRENSRIQGCTSSFEKTPLFAKNGGVVAIRACANGGARGPLENSKARRVTVRGGRIRALSLFTRVPMGAPGDLA